MKYIDPTGKEENAFGGGTVVNNSHSDVYIAFDADRMRHGGGNLDVVIPLHSGESSTKFTFDADAVIVGPNQNISGATEGSFKLSAGSVEIVDGEKGKLVLKGDPAYFAMKNRSNPSDRSGYQSAKDTPEQWKLNKTQAEMEKFRQVTALSVQQREENVKKRTLEAYWNKIRALFR